MLHRMNTGVHAGKGLALTQDCDLKLARGRGSGLPLQRRRLHGQAAGQRAGMLTRTGRRDSGARGAGDRGGKRLQLERTRHRENFVAGSCAISASMLEAVQPLTSIIIVRTSGSTNLLRLHRYKVRCDAGNTLHAATHRALVMKECHSA